MRRAAVAALALCACPSGSHLATDTVVLEVNNPVHLRIMQREEEQNVDCGGQGGLDWLKCLFTTNAVTCEWLEVDSPTLAASGPMGPELSACQNLSYGGPRINVGHSMAYRLEVAPTADRVVVEIAPGQASVFWLLDGWIVGQGPAAFPPDWVHLATLEQQLTLLYRLADAATAPRLEAYARAHGGDAAVVDLMNEVNDRPIDTWAALYETVEDPVEKKRALDAMHAFLREEHTSELAVSLLEHPDLQPPDFARVIAAIATEQVETSTWYDYLPLLEELARRKDPLAGDLACRIYGMQVLSGLPTTRDEYSELQDTEAELGALNILSTVKTPCPWLQIALDQKACDAELRCGPDGGLLEDDLLGEADDDYDSVEVPPQLPLCSRAMADRALKIRVEDDGEGGSRDGLVLLSAAWARGGVSKDLLQRNARRTYRFEYPPVPPALLDDGGVDDSYEPSIDEAPCRRPRELADAVCRLPLTVTELPFGGCRLRVDDKAKVVRVEELKAK